MTVNVCAMIIISILVSVLIYFWYPVNDFVIIVTDIYLDSQTLKIILEYKQTTNKAGSKIMINNFMAPILSTLPQIARIMGPTLDPPGYCRCLFESCYL